MIGTRNPPKKPQARDQRFLFSLVARTSLPTDTWGRGGKKNELLQRGEDILVARCLAE